MGARLPHTARGCRMWATVAGHWSDSEDSVRPVALHLSSGSMAALIAVSVGNSRTRIGLVVDGQLEPTPAMENTDVVAIARAVLGLHGDAPIVMASVNEPVAVEIEEEIRRRR